MAWRVLGRAATVVQRMNLGRVFASAAVRKLAYVLVAALCVWAGIGRAHADEYFTNPETAYAACDAWAGVAIGNAPPGTYTVRSCTTTFSYGSPGYYICRIKTTGGSAISCDAYRPNGTANRGNFYWNSACPAGSTWNEVTKKCHDPARCLAKSAVGFGWNAVPGAQCRDNCEFTNTSGQKQISFVGGAGKTFYSSEGMRPTGAACVPGGAEPIDSDQQCSPSGAGTSCVRPSGEHCHTASTGKQICWRPGETGEKTDGPVLQKANAGNEAIAPANITLPSGDTLQQQGSPVGVQISGGGGSSSNVTINNYNTTNGTNAGTPATDSGGPTSGTGPVPPGAPTSGGTPTGGGGTGDGEGAGASGGEACTAPPAVTGDPVGAMLAQQLWKARCAIESNNPENETGNIADCGSPWTVSGTDKQVNRARALRQAGCPDLPASELYNGDGTGETEPGVTNGLQDLLPGGLDNGRFSFGSTCPTIPTVNVMGKVLDFNTGPLCDWLTVGGWFVVLFAGLASLRLLTEA